MTSSFVEMEPFERAKFIIRNRDDTQYKQAYITFMEEAERGNHEAEYCLGLMLARGQGVMKNHSAARIWFEKAERGGLPLFKWFIKMIAPMKSC